MTIDINDDNVYFNNDYDEIPDDPAEIPLTGDYLIDMVWWTEDLREIPLGEMTRDHVRNALQWALRRQESHYIKDGYTYQAWITAFTVRLLDPNLP